MESTQSIVFEQMLVIIILIAVGYGCYKKQWITDAGAKTMSFLVVNITNPAIAISSAFSDDISITHKDILIGIAICFILFIVLIIIGHLLAFLLEGEKTKRKYYTMLGVYSNIGFIGIPVVSSVLGDQAIVYVTMFIIAYNIFFYTHGYIVMLSGEKNAEYRISWKTFINSGTVSGIIALIVFWFRLRFPDVIEDTLTYSGKATTFLAMIVLGVALAKIPIKSMFSNKKLWILWLIRYLLFPLAAGFCMKRVFGSNLLTGSMILLLAMPAGNMPIILAQQYDLDTSVLSPGVFISTILSLVTVTLSAMMI